MAMPPELARWRKVTRQTLLARRLAASPADHARWSAAIELLLRAGFDALGGMTVGFCWPYQAEFAARPFVEHLLSRGARAALPAVIAKGAPLEFREWRPGVEMAAGVFDLPVPQGTSLLTPDALLIPAVGIGEHGDRLGYGGGFFDRTLATLDPQPLKVAIAFELSRLPSTDPQPHDVLMDFVVTEAGILAVNAAGLEPLLPARCRERVAAIAAERGLPRPRAARPPPG
jgi:5,10-methenyltetrahydrofolate synthetase